MTGYIKIHREIMDHWIYKDAEYFKVWAEMLLRARHSREPKTDLYHGIKYTVNYAQFVYGRKEWSKRLGISEQRLRGLFKKLIDDNMIKVVEHLPRMTIAEVINYEKYNHPDNHVPDIERSGNTDNNNQQDNHHVTTTQPPRNHHVTTKEECKECNNIYIGTEKEIVDYWNSKNIIRHGESQEVKKAIKNCKFKKEQIFEAINNYSTVYHDKDYFYSHKWRLDKFLKQKNGLRDFLSDGQQWINYQAKQDKPSGKQPEISRYRFVD